VFDETLIEPAADAPPDVAAFLAAQFGDARYAAAGVRTLAPFARLVLRDATGRVAAHQALFWLAVVGGPDRRVGGLGDLAVASEHRGGGLGRRLATTARTLLDERGAELVLTRTAALGGLFAELGFLPDAPVTGLLDGVPAPISGLWTWSVDGTAPAPLVLADADF
jgi:predicted N-acetyltransferase YhbS